MSPRVRGTIFLAGAVVLLGALAAALLDLPPLGAPASGYGARVNEVGVAAIGVTNMTMAVNFGFRALDTLGEEFVLLTAVTAVSLLLREARTGEERPEEERLALERTPPVQWLAPWPPLLLFAVGGYLAAYGHVAPGGGFQGGVLLAAALLSLYLALGFGAFSRATRPHVLEAVEATAFAGCIAIGLIGLVREGAFLANPLPLGTPGTLLSGGMVPILDGLVALAVGAALALIAFEFLQEVGTPTRAEKR
jgi:multicomponent Na+:H+ antiporter subunit B